MITQSSEHVLPPLATNKCSASGVDSSFLRCEGDNPFCLGIDLCGCQADTEPVSANGVTSDQPEPKRKKLAFSLKSRFQHVGDNEITEICKDYVPPNTEKNTRWSLSVFQKWKSSCAGDKKCPENILEQPDPVTLNFWLPCFIAKVRRLDRKPYPPKTIHQLMCGLLRYMRSVEPGCPNILDRKDPRFRDFHGACEVVFRRLHQSKIGTNVKHTPVITFEEEEKLWSSGALNVSDPKGLQQAVFYYVGKVYCIRGG